jgi:hypothetical protein
MWRILGTAEQSSFRLGQSHAFRMTTNRQIWKNRRECGGREETL